MPSSTETMPRKDYTPNDPTQRRIWHYVSNSPLRSLWDFQGIPPMVVARRTFASFMDDNLLSRAAELGYYFLFALFPTLLSASAIFGLVVRSGDLYVKLLKYLSLVVPPDAMKLVLDGFTQTAIHSSGGKLIFGLAAALWSASVGFSAIQDTLNIVYKVKETRPYWKVKGAAMLVTALLGVIISLTLTCLLLGTFSSHFLRDHVGNRQIALGLGILAHLVFDVFTAGMLILLFAVIYYFAPDRKNKVWHWLTPGAVLGIVGWFVASLSLRVYLHYFNSYSVTYGSLGAVIILLTWFYITGLMLLVGAEINSEIEGCAMEAKLKAQGKIPENATANAAASLPEPAPGL